MGQRSIANMVFIVLIAAALAFGLYSAVYFCQDVALGPGGPR